MAAVAQPPLPDRVKFFFRDGITSLSNEKKEYQNAPYQEHFQRSKEAIAQAIEGLSRTALILGAGACSDIPLESLANSFDRIVLVDGCTDHAKAAVGELDPKYRDKFVFQEADLTGMFHSFADEIDLILKKGLSYEEFVRECFHLLLNLKRTHTYDYQRERPSFVCSSLIASQLSANLMDMLDEVSFVYYERAVEFPSEWEDQLKPLITSLEVEHVEELHRLVEPTGRVYFADTLSVEQRVGNSAPKVEEMAGLRKVIECTNRLFNGPQMEWDWIQNDPDIKLTRIFHVTALTLTPK